MKFGIRVSIWVVVFFSGALFQCRYEEVEPLYADFQVTGERQAMLPVVFKEASEGAITWAWSFGTGNFFDGQHPPPQVYSEEGKYAVSLTVKNTQGDEDTKSIELVIGPPPAVLAQFSMPPHARVNDTVSFVNSSLFGTSFLWDFGPFTIQSEEVNPKQSFSSVGSRVIRLVATNSRGIDSVEQRLEVCDVPVSAFTTPGNSGTFSSNVGISFNSETSLLNATDSLVSYYWDFGDGKSSSERNPTHVYAQAGIFQVRLKIENLCGFNWSDEKQLIIEGPNACFSPSSIQCYVPCNITLTNCSTNSSIYNWDFGDGTISQQINPTKIFTTPGNYQIRLVASNGIEYDTSFSTLIAIGCPAKVSSGNWKVFMCHNLGVADNSSIPGSPSWEINGGYWQWGNSEMAAPGPTLFSPNEGTISNWVSTPSIEWSWSDTFKSANDPCPTGFRVPSQLDWEGVTENNNKQYLGAWNISATNYGAGLLLGEKLFLPAAGYRRNDTGTLTGRGWVGVYWSSTSTGANTAWRMYFYNELTYVVNELTSSGYSIRCISE